MPVRIKTTITGLVIDGEQDFINMVSNLHKVYDSDYCKELKDL